MTTNPYSLRKQPYNVRHELAERLRRVRKAAGIPQAELAERSGLSLGSVRRFESTGEVSLKHLTLMADVSGRLADFDGLFVFDEALARLEARLEKEERRGGCGWGLKVHKPSLRFARSQSAIRHRIVNSTFYDSVYCPNRCHRR